MPKAIHLLTAPACKNASCPPDKARVRLNDGGGLYLEVTPNGSKRWFWKFYPEGKESRLALGSFPEVSLMRARAARDEARQGWKDGTNPSHARKAALIAKRVSAAQTFEAVTREYHQLKAPGWSASHAAQFMRCCEKDLFPWIGALPLRSITGEVLLDALQRVEARGATQLARDLRQYAGQVFEYGLFTQKCERNPAQGLNKRLRPHAVKHHSAVTEPAKAGQLMRAIHGYQGQPATRTALLLSALLFQRPGNIRAMQWAWIDLEAAMLTIPAAEMKRSKADKMNGRPHFVPLSRQAVEALRDLKPLTGGGVYVFPSLRTGQKPMSENTLNAALRGMGYSSEEMTAHGFRAMARTMIREGIPGALSEVIEAQLAHAKGGLGEAYDRAEFMSERKALMQTWADYLDQLKAWAKVTEFKAA